MKSRNTPCTECRKHRRKCIRTASSKCSRCERLGKICLQPTNDSNQCNDEEDIDVDNLQNQVEQLEWAIHEMETQMRNLTCRSSNNNNVTSLIRRNNKRSSTPISQLQNNLIQNLMYQWQFQIKNGNFQIETGIRNISDLLQFQTPNLNYLSPFSNSSSSSNSSMSSSSSVSGNSLDEAESYRGGESGLIMHFGTDAGSLIPFTIKVLTHCVKKNHQPPPSLLLPSSLLLDSRVVTDQLINIYFSCHNVYTPMVHQATFMEKYRQLQDPMTDLLSLSICCYVCAIPCDHFFYTSIERRSTADFFFDKAKSIILDQFDLPEKRLVNVMSINLLSKYMHMTLKFRDCRKLIIMAYQICIDLRDEFRVRAPYADPGCFGDNPHISNVPDDTHVFAFNSSEDDEEDSVNVILYARHVTITLCVRRLLDYIANQIVDDSCFHFPKWKYLVDEPQETKRFIEAQNWLLGLFNHPFIGNFVRQIHRIHLGLVCTLSFESIIRLEDVITECSASIPDEFRLCDDLKDMELCKAAIDKTTDCVLLMSFIHFHVFLVSIYSCLLQPIALGADHDQFLSFVQQRSLENSLKGCQLLIYAVHRISKTAGTTSCHYTLAVCDYLFHAIDVLVLLSLSPNAYVAKEARIIMKTCLDEVDSIKFMQEHNVPSSASPIFSGLLDFNDASTFNLEYYDQYPQPWFALMYDASHYIASLK